MGNLRLGKVWWGGYAEGYLFQGGLHAPTSYHFRGWIFNSSGVGRLLLGAFSGVLFVIGY
jgi:hypothetical protein